MPSGTSQMPFSQAVFQLLWVHLHLSVSTVERQQTRMKIKQDDATSRSSIAENEYRSEKLPLLNHDGGIHNVTRSSEIQDFPRKQLMHTREMRKVRKRENEFMEESSETNVLPFERALKLLA